MSPSVQNIRFFKMVLAPRHINRKSEVGQILHSRKIEFSIFEQSGDVCDVILVDKIGVLIDLFLAGDFAFVGGTMTDTGGHNILEPVWAGTPVVYGPDIRNIKDLSDYIISHNFGTQVSSPDELTHLVENVIKGSRKFNTKTDTGSDDSPTALAGNYILKKLDLL